MRTSDAVRYYRRPDLRRRPRAAILLIRTSPGLESGLPTICALCVHRRIALSRPDSSQLPSAQTRNGTVPPPESVFGFTAGADYKLATYDQSIEYFKKLAAASRYVKLVEAGKTSQGRTMYFALISTPENLAKIDRYREIWQRLAHPAGPDRRGGAAARAPKARRSSTSTAACTRPRWPARSTRRCSPTTC